jgi:hypothetical protein
MQVIVAHFLCPIVTKRRKGLTTTRPFSSTSTRSVLTRTNQQDKIIEIKFIGLEFTEFPDNTSSFHSRVLIKINRTYLAKSQAQRRVTTTQPSSLKEIKHTEQDAYTFLSSSVLYASIFNTKSESRNSSLVHPQSPAML